MEYNPYLSFFEELTCDITPTDFEKYCFRILKAYAEKENLSDYTIEHNVKLKAHDGMYQIDILLQFKIAGLAFKVLAECKQYKRPVERKVVAELYSKLNSLGAQKGIIIATSGFQSGTVEFAQEHGIALIQVYDKYWTLISGSCGMEEDRSLWKILLAKNLPQYYAIDWTDKSFPGLDFFPTEKEIQEARHLAKIQLAEAGKHKSQPKE